MRGIGPANMGGRVTAFAIVPTRPSTMYLATASGGLWKTVNQANTWTPIFDDQPTVSLGDVAVAPSDPEIVWVGTGEANARNSVSWGDGVYKSLNGGKTWQHMGLKDSEHIGRILIHPKNPDIVYVAALGHLWGPNKERGVYKTQDGGKTWELSKFLNEDTGFIDLAMDPKDPDTIYAAAYCVRRDAFSGGNPAIQTGPEAGLYKTTDAGKNWKRLSSGLPERPLGRCGIAVSRKDPKIVYAVVQTDKTVLVRETELGQGAPPKRSARHRRRVSLQRQGRNLGQAQRPVSPALLLRHHPHRSQRPAADLGARGDAAPVGGWRPDFPAEPGAGTHADHHALWINPANSDQMILGGDGGLYISFDASRSWEHVHNLPIGQFYGIGVDMRKPYRIYGGLQDNGSLGRPSQDCAAGKASPPPTGFATSAVTASMPRLSPPIPIPFMPRASLAISTASTPALPSRWTSGRIHPRRALPIATTGRRPSCCRRTVQARSTMGATTSFAPGTAATCGT